MSRRKAASTRIGQRLPVFMLRGLSGIPSCRTRGIRAHFTPRANFARVWGAELPISVLETPVHSGPVGMWSRPVRISHGAFIQIACANCQYPYLKRLFIPDRL